MSIVLWVINLNKHVIFIQYSRWSSLSTDCSGDSPLWLQSANKQFLQSTHMESVLRLSLKSHTIKIKNMATPLQRSDAQFVPITYLYTNRTNNDTRYFLLYALNDLSITSQMFNLKSSHWNWVKSKVNLTQHIINITSSVYFDFQPFKGARSDWFRFFSNFRRFWYQKKAHIFLITPGEFHSWKMYHLEDINENVTSYGYYN